MDKIFEKFGLYDFMGIWGPGALTVTYYLFTFQESMDSLFSFLKITSLNLSKGYILAILYIAVAYIAGVILHEIGRLFADVFSLFNPDESKKNFNENNYFAKSLAYSVKKLEDFESLSFTEAISFLKYNNDISTKKIDTYRSVYALARSLFLCFTIHAILTLIFSLWLGMSWAIIVKVFIDIVVAALFYVRAYRYFYMWIGNVFIQYDIVRKQQLLKRETG